MIRMIRDLVEGVRIGISWGVMTRANSRAWLAVGVLAFALGWCWPRAQADGGGFDRQLAERLVRAVEAQTRAIEAQARACERR